MQFIPVSTRVLMPPQDDLCAVLKDALPPLRERDVVVITSKVVSIHEGRCVPVAGTDKEALVRKEAEVIIPRPYWNRPLTVARRAFVGSAGIDQSNGAGYYVLLPEDVFLSAQKLHEFLIATYGLKELGVIITDSASMPFRYGAIGVALAWWGIAPLQNHVGRKDLFGRAIKAERSNVVDGIAAGATVVSGEVDEGIPVVIAREVPNLSFTPGNTSAELLPPFNEDVFRVLYEQFLADQG